MPKNKKNKTRSVSVRRLRRKRECLKGGRSLKKRNLKKWSLNKRSLNKGFNNKFIVNINTPPSKYQGRFREYEKYSQEKRDAEENVIYV
jgi:hypothetical protein